MTYTVRQPSASQPLVSASARAVSPRYVSGACIPSFRVSPSSSSSAANGETDHHIMPSSRARSRTSAMPHREAAPTSIGASPPPAVAAQDAWRNSWLVATRSAARVRTRSGSQTSAIEPLGRTSSSSSISSTRTGARDSMPSTAIPSAILPSSSPSSGCASARAAARLAYVLGEQQLAAGRRPQAVLGDLQGPLVGDLEVADLLDVVAPELHPQGVLLGGREDVQDAAAHGELAALLDQLDTGVRGCRERVHDLAQVGGLPAAQRDGLQVAEPLDLRLEHGAHRRDDHADRAGLRVVLPGVREAAQDGEAAAHGVASAGESRSCGQRLPGGELRDGVRRQQGAQRGGQVLGLPAGRGDGEHRAPGAHGPARPRRRGGRRAGRPGRHGPGGRRRRPSPLPRERGSVTTTSSRPCRLMKVPSGGASGATRRARHVARAGGLQRTTPRSG